MDWNAQDKACLSGERLLQSAVMARYVQYMLSGQTNLEELQNDRYPDIEPQTLTDLRPAAAQG